MAAQRRAAPRTSEKKTTRKKALRKRRKVVLPDSLKREIKEIGLREFRRRRIGQHTIEKALHKHVHINTYRKILAAIDAYKKDGNKSEDPATGRAISHRKGKVAFMAYKDPERKRQWEREHREQRNAARRKQRLSPGSGPCTVSKPAPNPVNPQESRDGWTVLASIAVGIAVVLLGVFAGAATVPNLGRR